MSFITLPYGLERDPPPFETNAIKYPESLVRHFLKTYTKRGGKVFDPFAGLGTTVFVAEEMGRIPFGVEYDPKRYEWVAGQMEHWTNLANGDSGKLSRMASLMSWPKMDFCMSSPPFMQKNMKWNPLFAGNPAKGGYDIYLKQMRNIYRQVAGVMKKNATVIIQCDNLPGRVYTPLVRDLSVAIGGVLRLENEVIVAWKNAPKDYPHTHCLVFRKK
jgi:hypothetical protein